MRQRTVASPDGWPASKSKASSRPHRLSPAWWWPRSRRSPPHPEADKLRICQVNTGAGSSQQIVCGAANARAGLKAPLATVGAMLPGDVTIKAAKLRGVESAGMLCSAKELGLAQASSGLMELPADAPVGAALRDYLQLDDRSSN